MKKTIRLSGIAYESLVNGEVSLFQHYSFSITVYLMDLSKEDGNDVHNGIGTS